MLRPLNSDLKRKRQSVMYEPEMNITMEKEFLLRLF